MMITSRTLSAPQLQLTSAVNMRQLREQLAPGEHNNNDIALQLVKQRNCCYWCSRLLTVPYHVDHVIPLARGGTNGPDNLVCACPHCNLSKGDKMPYTEWQPPHPINLIK
jgi:5-methylcytosine-specific restriction endonuclease McrA